MLLGLDVGGTFTDGVAVLAGKVINTVKTPTTHGNLLEGILVAVDQIVKEVGNRQFTRITLSTTIVTNALVEGKVDPVGLFIMPGPGMDIQSVLPIEPYVLSGYVDHRGRIVSKPRRDEVVNACRQFDECKVFAISGKFSVRNPDCEQLARQWVKEEMNPDHITIGSGVAGTLNFLRRTNSAYYNAAVWRHFNAFATAVEQAFKAREIHAPIYILKADGGTLPLEIAKNNPVEAIFTGPAASVLGIMAMNPVSVPALSLDIGGTTTDIALWQNGVPLFAEGGACVAGFATALRSFRLNSVGIGGDSFVRQEEGVLKIGPMRRGSAMAVGGDYPTVTDAMVVAGLIDFGHYEFATQAMRLVAASEETLQQTADRVLSGVVDQICQGIEDMFTQQASQPVYRVEDMIKGTSIVAEKIVGVGGAAAGLVPLVAKRMGLPYKLPKQGMVANAIGAALARSTVEINLRADTVAGYYTVIELGIKSKLPKGNFTLVDAQALGEKHLEELAMLRGISLGVIEMIYSEEFNVIEGFSTMGKILSCRLQIKPGVIVNNKEGS
ncbi:hydantoinase/oxoprolinase family protein [Pelosinus sp. sgz500959]|uniref:hydantoinase/oxoprolinase family protein n=1 Tax=Pelosinus sp. sgz500959 TaxID=3242472 RepID=UPI00366F0167